MNIKLQDIAEHTRKFNLERISEVTMFSTLFHFMVKHTFDCTPISIYTSSPGTITNRNYKIMKETRNTTRSREEYKDINILKNKLLI